jgi:hypothetical protein
VKDAPAAFAETEGQLGHTGTMTARFGLWQLTQDKAHLEDAHRRLCFLRDHAPAEYRDSMIENVPLHKSILRAWAELGAGGAQG